MVEIYEQKEASITASDVQYAIDNGRGERTEFFPGIPENDVELSVTACSLANAGGGQIIIGVNVSGEIIGVTNSETESEAVDLLHRDIERRLDTTFFTTTVELDNEKVVMIWIREFGEYPLSADGRFYQRHQTENLRLKPDQVFELVKTTSSE